MIVFDKPGKENTKATLDIAFERAKRDDLKVLVATTTGETAVIAAKEAEKRGMLDRLIIVGSVPDKGVQKMTPENQKILSDMGVPVVFTTHLLSGAERGLSTRFHGIYPVEIMAHTLRMLSQGVKVAVEISVMALDCGVLPYGVPAVAVGGTGRGADTACVVTPAGGNAILDCKVHEILCKPY